MKNIHILPTDKPSRLVKDDFGKLIYSINMDQEQNHFEPQHLYITNSEEIKEGDWFYDLDTKYIKIKQSWENSHLDFNGKKIILTTDQDLIKDGVQAIDDEFLEWFVKNPSCEEVEVYREGYKKNGMIDEATSYQYKIIIPKEESKQETLEEEFKFKNRQMGAAGFVGNKIMENMISKFKQETLEEAAERFYPIPKGGSMWMPSRNDLNKANKQEGFIEGTKWQAERMYSEEEVIEFGEMIAWNMVGKTITESFIRTVSKELFQQFKKK